MNSGYIVEGNIVKLENGRSEVPTSPDSAIKIITTAWEKAVSGDLTGDSVEDSAVILIQQPGGSGTFYYIAAAIRDLTNNTFTGTNAVLLGDRILPIDISIGEGKIVVKYKVRKDYEPMTEKPSTEVEKQFTVQNGILREIAFQGEKGKGAYSVKRIAYKDGKYVFYPGISGFRGELLMDYMNQSLKKPVDKYVENESYADVVIDYTITREDDKILSVLFRGTAYMKGIGKINIMESVNLDIGKSTNPITFDNIIKNTDTDRMEVKKILDEAARAKGILGGFEAEGVRIYFAGKDIIFFYMPLDDSAKEFVELSVPELIMKSHLNSDFGATPAS